MVPLAIKNITHEKFKLAIGLVSVGLSIVLVIVLLGVYFGSLKQARALPENSGANAWIVREGTRDIFHTVSLLPAGKSGELAKINGVEAVSEVINSPTSISLNGQDNTVGIIGFDSATGFLGPWDVTEGTTRIGSGQVVVDKVLAKENGLELGQSVEVGNRSFTISGISAGSNAIAFQYIFMDINSLRDSLDIGGITNYYLAKTNLSPQELEEAIQPFLPSAVVRTSNDVASDNADVIEQSFLNILLVLIFVGIFVGVLIIAISVFNAVSDRLRDYAVLKAVGAKPRQLYTVVFIQSFIMALGGFVIGVALYGGLYFVLPTVVPEIEVSVPPIWFLYVFIAAVVMSLIAGLLPMRKLSKVDPIMVFTA